MPRATRPTCGGQVIPQSVLHPGSAGDAPLRVALLGGFGVAVGDGPLGQFGTPRLQSLVAYLLMHRAAPQLRPHLAFLLWPDSSEAQARTTFAEPPAPAHFRLAGRPTVPGRRIGCHPLAPRRTALRRRGRI